MKNYRTELFANGQRLDLFDDEVVKVSNNTTGLFDIDKLPSDFTRSITLPASKINNAFFQHYYDIDVTAPFFFVQNQKVNCYLDISGYLLVQGYLRLNKVNVTNNRVDSYDVTLFGSISNLGRDLQTNTLNDISGLSVYNHTASYDNISTSWDGNLFGGDIVYPLIDYGKGYQYSAATPDGGFGIDDEQKSLYVKDFKPAIRVKKVVDKIFEEFGYTYSSSFFEKPMWDDIYMVCNYGGQYPIFDNRNIETYGTVQIRPTSGSTTDTVLTSNYQQLVWDTIESDPSFVMKSGSVYDKPINGPINGKLRLNLHITGSGTGDLGYPKLDFALASPTWPGNSNAYTPINVDVINKFLQETYSQLDKVGEKTYTVEQEWYNINVTNGEKRLIMKSTNTGGTGNFTVTVGKDGNTQSYWSVEEIGNAADYLVMNIPQNMPYGENGISCLDFIKGLQKKYNLVISPSKTKPNHFEIETFNEWYKTGKIIDITDFVDESKPISVIPANTLAVNELVFSDKEGKDFLSKDFVDANNRTYGKSFYKDEQNQFSSGKLDVVTEFSASPLRYINGSGDSGTPPTPPTVYTFYIIRNTSVTQLCDGFGTFQQVYSNLPDITFNTILYNDSLLTQPFTGWRYIKEANIGDTIYEVQTTTGRIIGEGTCEDIDIYFRY